jgi:hypothetical protein
MVQWVWQLDMVGGAAIHTGDGVIKFGQPISQYLTWNSPRSQKPLHCPLPSYSARLLVCSGTGSALFGLVTRRGRHSNDRLKSQGRRLHRMVESLYGGTRCRTQFQAAGVMTPGGLVANSARPVLELRARAAASTGDRLARTPCSTTAIGPGGSWLRTS